MASPLPAGTVTFLFADLDDTLTQAPAEPEQVERARAIARDVFRACVETAGGTTFGADAARLSAAFERGSDALAAAVEVVGSLRDRALSPPPQVRIGVHAGDAEPAGTGYVGETVRVGRLVCAAAAPGQILLSGAGLTLSGGHRPERSEVVFVGEHRLDEGPQTERLYEVRHPSIPSVEASPRTLDTLPNNLPVRMTSFVGRNAEVREVAAALRAHRVVTVTGTGGSGKTRLAVRVAAETLPVYPDGCWFVDLTGIREPALVDAAVVAAVGAHEGEEGPRAAIASMLQGKRALIVLDNCEHLLDAARSVVEHIVGSAEHAAVLATSRQRLGAGGEAVVALGALSLTPRKDDGSVAAAVRLFAARASAVSPGFRLDERTAPVVERIVGRLEGIPLAIELAAARVRSLTVEQIDDRLAERFAVIGRSVVDDDERQRTVRALVDWSVDLLTPAERHALARASVFADGFDIDAAEAVCGFEPLDEADVLEAITSLVDKSLLTVEARSDRARYRLLELTREQALDRLEPAEAREVHRRHLAYVLDLINRERQADRDAQQVDRLRLDLENIRVALRWGIDAGHPDVVEVASRMWAFWSREGMLDEGCRWLGQVVEILPEVAPDRARNVLHHLANLENLAGRIDSAAAHYEAAIGFLRDGRDPSTLANALNDYGVLREREGDVVRACALFEEAAAIATEIGNNRVLTRVSANIGGVLAVAGDDACRPWLAQAIELGQREGFPYLLAVARNNFATYLIGKGEVDEAFEFLMQAQDGFEEANDLPNLLSNLEGLADVARLRGMNREAAIAFAAADAERRRSSIMRHAGDTLSTDAAIAATRAAMGEQAFADAWDEGAALSWAEALAGVARAPALVPAPPAPRIAEPPSGGTFRREGDVWLVGFGGREVRLRHAKGLGYIAALLAEPGREFHALEMAMSFDGDPGAEGVRGDAGEILDPTARAQYRERVRSLQDEIDEAEEWGDIARADRAREEMEFLTRELSAAFGLGGRARKGADAGERARKAVTNRIRDALKRIRDEHPALADHLAGAIRTGIYCSYAPALPVTWDL